MICQKYAKFKKYAFYYIEHGINNIIHIVMIMKEITSFKESHFIHPLLQISACQ